MISKWLKPLLGTLAIAAAPQASAADLSFMAGEWDVWTVQYFDNPEHTWEPYSTNRAKFKVSKKGTKVKGTYFVEVPEHYDEQYSIKIEKDRRTGAFSATISHEEYYTERYTGSIDSEQLILDSLSTDYEPNNNNPVVPQYFKLEVEPTSPAGFTMKFYHADNRQNPSWKLSAKVVFEPVE